jgi:hypothetical protein
MVRTSTTLAFLSLLVAGATASAQDVLIDFEGYPEMTHITDQYAGEGVTFYLLGTDREPYIATHGEPTVAFVTSYPAPDSDVPVSGENSLAAGGSADYGAAFSSPVSRVSLALSDFGDCMDVPIGYPVSAGLDAYDASGALVDTMSFTIPHFAAGSPDDGNVAVLTVSGPHIVRVETHGVAQDCGYTIDDFAFTREGCLDSDQDGVCDADDICPDTAPSDPEAGVPSMYLGRARWADMDGDGTFESGSGKAARRGGAPTMADTGGCSCAQIIQQLHLGRGHHRLGCSVGAMRRWEKSVKDSR